MQLCYTLPMKDLWIGNRIWAQITANKEATNKAEV